MLTTTGLNFGVRRGIPHLLGICIGFPVMLALIGLGFGTLFQLYPILHEIIKIIGIVYLFFLAWKIATTRSGLSAAASAAVPAVVNMAINKSGMLLDGNSSGSTPLSAI